MNLKRDKSDSISRDLPSPAPSVTSVRYSPRTTTSVKNVEKRENDGPRTYKPLTICPGCATLEAIPDGDYLCKCCRAEIHDP